MVARWNAVNVLQAGVGCVVVVSVALRTGKAKWLDSSGDWIRGTVETMGRLYSSINNAWDAPEGVNTDH
jgi:hypothetical protein